MNSSLLKYPALLVAALSLCFSGCTAISVRPVPANEKMTTVFIRTNPKVAVADFLDVLVDGFARHGIAATIVSESADVKDAYVVSYVAFRKWDLTPYLTDATISIDKEGRRIARAEYHLRGGGGLSLMKWERTKIKMDPVIDELLHGMQR